MHPHNTEATDEGTQDFEASPVEVGAQSRLETKPAHCTAPSLHYTSRYTSSRGPGREDGHHHPPWSVLVNLAR